MKNLPDSPKDGSQACEDVVLREVLRVSQSNFVEIELFRLKKTPDWSRGEENKVERLAPLAEKILKKLTFANLLASSGARLSDLFLQLKWKAFSKL
jgi:hypothetical protein